MITMMLLPTVSVSQSVEEATLKASLQYRRRSHDGGHLLPTPKPFFKEPISRSSSTQTLCNRPPSPTTPKRMPRSFSTCALIGYAKASFKVRNSGGLARWWYRNRMFSSDAIKIQIWIPSTDLVFTYLTKMLLLRKILQNLRWLCVTKSFPTSMSLHNTNGITVVLILTLLLAFLLFVALM